MSWDYCIEKIRGVLPKSWLLFEEIFRFWQRLCKYNASFSADNDIEKMQYMLLRENHVIEKGLSIRNPKTGFGQVKVAALIKRLSIYFDRYGDIDNKFILYPMSTISKYIDYMKNDGVNIDRIESSFLSLCTKTGLQPDTIEKPAGVFVANKKDIQSEAKGNYSDLLFSRHSIRYFTEELPSKDLLNEALRLAARTPSACNRQTWHTHIYMGKKSHELLSQQGGCGGFFNDVHCSIVVTADMKGFLDYEPFQCYVDGGLYAMNLINALHYKGFGTIPLSCGFYSRKLNAIQRAFDIPKNEVMIVIIGVGVMTDKVKVAESTRKPVEETNVFH